ncbi:MAG TPA: SUMF1/EgtB/PvdO family nonheme iron enzyme [Anaerolineales bacterium]|nr:SUMF1/EgtB/PvdO family nonheme iron enzyme [Anaerolineales bacterium]
MNHEIRIFVTLFSLLWLVACTPTGASTPTPIPTLTSTVAPSATSTPTNTLSPPTDTPTPTATSTPVTPTLTPTPTPIPTASSYGAPLALVPAGDFIMGFDAEDAAPSHTVFLNEFRIDKYEVTNALYKDCVDAGICQHPNDSSSYTRLSYYGDPQFNNYPIINVTWNMAKTYCEWRGGRLPTEAEWEKAARGTDGRTYPWGEELDCSRANYGKYVNSDGTVGCPVEGTWFLSGSGRFFSLRNGSMNDLSNLLGYIAGDVTYIGRYPSGKSPYGVYDMVGNVSEWIADWYSATYYQTSPVENPLGPETGDRRVVRGGWYGAFEDSLSVWKRFTNNAGTSSDYIGFRCVLPTP